jgi:phage baseplate assembly protein W
MDNFLDHPFHISGEGQTAPTSANDHYRDMIYQVLFTNPGERVNRPDFGCGLLQKVFAPNSEVLATTTQFLVQGSLERWLGDVIQTEQVRVSSEGERLVVEVAYRRLGDGERREDRFAAPGGGA